MAVYFNLHKLSVSMRVPVLFPFYEEAEVYLVNLYKSDSLKKKIVRQMTALEKSNMYLR